MHDQEQQVLTIRWGEGRSLSIRGWIAVISLAIPALLPLFQPGFFVSDDGRFHVYRLGALADAWTHGVLHPRLFPEFGFGYGQAVLHYYSPASYWPGALLVTLGVDASIATEIIIALGFILAALAMYGYVRSLWGTWAGVLAAVIYTYFPYHLADAYIRGAIPEFLAFIFPPLILWAYTIALKGGQEGADDAEKSGMRRRYALLWAALAWAGLALTHHLTSLLMAPVALVYAIVLVAWGGTWRRLWGVLGSLILALGLSAAYWFPALWERASVDLGVSPSRGFENHMLDAATLIGRWFTTIYRDADGFALIYPLSWLTAALTLGALGLLIWRTGRRQLPSSWPVLLYHLGLVLVTVFLITSYSLSIWYPLTPILGHLQYPWRFLVLTGLGVAVSGTTLITCLPRRLAPLITASIAILAIAVAMLRLPLEPLPLPPAAVIPPEPMWQEDAAVGQIGATWTGEFVPATVTEQRWAIGRSLAEASDQDPLEPQPRITLLDRSYARLRLTLERDEPMQILLHQFHQPGWQTRINGESVSNYATGVLGLITLDAPAGDNEIEFDYGFTLARLTGSLISTLSILVWAGLALITRYRHQPITFSSRMASATAILLLLLTLALDTNSLGLGQRVWTPAAVSAQLGDLALLTGYDTNTVSELNTLDVTLYWFALRQTSQDVKVFVHLLDGSGQVIAQHDGDPVGGFTPTTRWRAGEIIADTHRIPLPPELPVGSYGLRAGMYELTAEGVRNLIVEPPAVDNRVDLGTIPLP